MEFSDPDGSGSSPLELSKRYLFGPAIDQILAQEDVTVSLSAADRVLWPLTDNLGTVRDLADQTGAIAEHYLYNSAGRLTAIEDGSGNPLSSASTRYLFTGREYDDAVDLQYNRARWYDAALLQWLSEDPIGFAAGDANLRRMVGNSYTNATDPSGLHSTWWESVGKNLWHWHHLLDQSIFTPEFLKKHGLEGVIDPNCPEYGWWLRGGDHIGTGGIHPEGWSDDWKRWINGLIETHGADVQITKEMIEAQLSRMKLKYAGILARGRHVLGSGVWEMSYGRAHDHFMNLIKEQARIEGMNVDEFLRKEVRGQLLDEIRRLGPGALKEAGALRNIFKSVLRRAPAGIGLLLALLSAKEVQADYEENGAVFAVCNQTIPIRLVEELTQSLIGEAWDEWFDEVTDQYEYLITRYRAANPNGTEEEIHNQAWNELIQHAPDLIHHE